ncbi:MAG: tetratricopeptide repeat protein [Myxococcales bacterium]|nr:tetratricopeptide repeat protein [Myxococcales bacterium]
MRDPPSPWIIAPAADAALILGAPLLSAALVLPLAALVGSRVVWLVVMTFGSVGHHLPGFLRTYGDRALFRQHRARFLLAPPLVFATSLWFAAYNLHGVLLLSLVWSVWHGMMQHYGFLRVYDAKVGARAPEVARLDWWMTCAWFSLCLLWSPVQGASVLASLFDAGFWLIPPAALRVAGTVTLVLTLAISALYLIMTARWRRRGVPVSPRKLALLVTTTALLYFARVMTRDPFLTVALFEVLHDVQYLAIVWAFNRGVAERGQGGRLGRWLYRPRALAVAVYVTLCLAYGALAFGVALWRGDGLGTRVVVALLATSGILHFYYDGFIWKLRRAEVSAGLGIEAGAGASSPPAPGRSRRELAHLLIFVGMMLALWRIERRPAKPGALEVCEAMVALVPESPTARQNLGAELLARGELEGAVAQLREAAHLRPGFLDVQLALGRALLASGAAEAAREVFTRALTLAPEHGEAHLALAELALGDRRIEDAIDHYQRALAVRERDAKAHGNVAYALAASGRLDDGLRHVQRAIELEPRLLLARVNAGLILDALGRRDEALAELRVAVSLEPSSVQAWSNLGGVLMKLGRGAEAARAFRAALAIDPSFAPARHNLARLSARPR